MIKDKKPAEHLRHAAIIEKRKNELTVSLDDYLAKRSEQKHFRAAQTNKIN